MHNLQRKYIDLIHQVSSKWVNWDPPISIEVGSYGIVNRETGEFIPQGCIYRTTERDLAERGFRREHTLHPDPKFQAELDKLGIPLAMADYPIKECAPEEEFVAASRGARRVGMALGPQVGLTGVATASFKGQWQFEQGRRDALLVMHCPRMRCIPEEVLRAIVDLPLFKDKWLVANVYTCPAYTMLLSNKSGERISLELASQVPLPTAPGVSAGAEAGFDWYSDANADFFRKGCDKDGSYCYTPLLTLRRRTTWVDQMKSAFRIYRDGQQHELLHEPTVDDLWEDCHPEWSPLDEDGEEDPIELVINPNAPSQSPV